MELNEKILDDATSLLREALEGLDGHYGFGTMSCAAYDTAWVSMVTKTVGGQTRWLFPECFQFLLDTQSATGGWETGISAPIDAILNTAAPLLSLKRHARMWGNTLPQYDYQDLTRRIKRATAYLQAHLEGLDVSTAEHVGFEIIVPAMLDLLVAEDSTLVFDFASREALTRIKEAKMSRFRPEYLYGDRPMTVLHSLEAFIGKIDFNRIKHHTTCGSMMGSPSSTAAYLMNSSPWDEESEAYLRHVIQHAAGQGTGAVPSAFPSTHFESSWILTTLLRAGFSASQLECEELDTMIDILAASFEKEGGAVGYAPGFQADVDDTAKTIITLTAFGRAPGLGEMLNVFEATTHFRTYTGERDPSLTANCNALSALLWQPDVMNFSSQIQKATAFLCDYWWQSDGRIKDKWNTSYLYPSLLLVQVLVDLVQVLEEGKLPGLFDEEMRRRLAITLFQACLRPLLDQEADGSWDQCIEATAYGVLILTEARRLSFFNQLLEPVNEAIRRAIVYVDSGNGRCAQPNYIWIEKVSYASPLLTKSYLIAARWAAHSSWGGDSVGASLWTPPPREAMDKQIQCFHKLDLFASIPEWELCASVIEAALFTEMLWARRLDVFPRSDVAETDMDLDLVPLFWTVSNNRNRTYASTVFLYDMCFMAMLNSQLEEFMEKTAGVLYRGHMDDLRQVVHHLVVETTSSKALATKESDSGIEDEDVSISDTSSDTPAKSPEHELVSSTLLGFLKGVLEHRSIRSASAWDRKLLTDELHAYLLAHIQWVEHGNLGAAVGISTPTTSLVTAFPCLFHFAACHLGAALKPKTRGSAGDCFASAGEKYLAAAACRHLATMCRMYNVVGSAERGGGEEDLDSIHFPEFLSRSDLEIKKDALLRLAEFERESYFEAFRRLKDESQRSHMFAAGEDPESLRLGSRRIGICELFAQQVDLHAQVKVTCGTSARNPKDSCSDNVHF